MNKLLLGFSFTFVLLVSYPALADVIDRFRISQGYVQYSSRLSNHVTETNSGVSISFDFRPLTGRFSAPSRLGLLFYQVSGDQLNHSRVYQIYTYYDFTKIFLSERYPQLYFGYAYGRGVFDSDLQLKLNPEYNSMAQQLYGVNYYPYSLSNSWSTVASLVFGGYYQIPYTQLSFFVEYRYNRAVPPSFTDVDPYVNLPSYVERVLLERVKKDYTSEGMNVGLSFSF